MISQGWNDRDTQNLSYDYSMATSALNEENATAEVEDFNGHSPTLEELDTEKTELEIAEEEVNEFPEAAAWLHSLKIE